MKQGRSLQELAVEIQRQQNAKVDYLADTSALSMVDGENGIGFQIEGKAPFGMNDLAHSQIGQYLEIPAKYYERMRYGSPELLTHNVNHWLHNTDAPERRMIRTLDGNVRAFLSDRYRRIDNADVAETVLPIIGRMDGAQVMSYEITETKMYIKVVNPRVQT